MLPSGPRLVLRADAGHRLGSGHVMRLAALAEAAVDAGGAARMLVGGEPAASVAALTARGLDALALAPAEAREAAIIARHAHELAAHAIVLDGPHLDPGWIPALTAAGPGATGTATGTGTGTGTGTRTASSACDPRPWTIASLDDRGVAPLPTPVVINPGFGAEQLAERYPSSAVRLLGRRYHLLRREFRAFPPGGAPLAEVARRIVVTMGGSDPVRATARVLIQVPAEGHQIVVVLGPGFRAADRDELELAATIQRGRGAVVTFIDNPPSLAPILAGCDVAISAAGGTLTELAYLGRPTYAVAIVDDQVDVALRLWRAGLVAGGQPLDALSVTGLGVQLHRFVADVAGQRALAAASAASVDGLGPARILAALVA
jgi:spore coat polysaccharide biosynthesis predicted glycosyltransferase SpsG